MPATVTDLLTQIEQHFPQATLVEQLRLALICCHLGSRESEADWCPSKWQAWLDRAWCQWQAQSDRLAAVAEELDSLAATEPCEFQPAHIWTLIRAIKVQQQALDMVDFQAKQPFEVC